MKNYIVNTTINNDVWHKCYLATSKNRAIELFKENIFSCLVTGDGTDADSSPDSATSFINSLDIKCVVGLCKCENCKKGI